MLYTLMQYLVTIVKFKTKFDFFTVETWIFKLISLNCKIIELDLKSNMNSNINVMT